MWVLLSGLCEYKFMAPRDTYLVSLTLMAKKQVAHHVTHINKRLHF